MTIESNYSYYNNIKWNAYTFASLLLITALVVKIFSLQGMLPPTALYASMCGDGVALCLFVVGVWAASRAFEAQAEDQQKLLEAEKAKATNEKAKIEGDIAALQAIRGKVHCEVAQSIKGPSSKGPDMCKTIATNMKGVLAKAEESGDVTIVCQDGQLKAHSFMLDHPYLNLHKDGILELKRLKVETVKKILNFLYTGSLESLNLEEACHLFTFGSMACLEELKNHARRNLMTLFYQKNINIFLAFSFVDQIDIELEEFILSHFLNLTVRVKKEFLSQKECCDKFFKALAPAKSPLHQLVYAECHLILCDKSQVNPGERLLNELVAKNYAPALFAKYQLSKDGKFLSAAYTQKYPPAIRELGNLWQATKNFDKAFAFYQEAHDLGDIEGTFSLSNCYRHGLGVTPDQDKAVELIKEAVEFQHPKAFTILGMYYEHQRDMKKAFHNYDLAAHAGDKWAQYFLAQIYHEPHKYQFQNVVNQSKKEAIFWCSQAIESAEGNFPEAAKLLQILVST